MSQKSLTELRSSTKLKGTPAMEFRFFERVRKKKRKRGKKYVRDGFE